jgi:membrane protease YdiL (CAAX protease family)
MRVWDGFTAFSFSVSVCFVYWALFIMGSYGTDYTITMRDPQFAIDTKFILLMAAPFLPALYCFVTYPECRSSLWKVNASWTVYLVAIATGLCLPFLSYPGTHYLAFPWGRPVAIHLAMVFAKNLFLSPFWEEIIWRGCFLKKVRLLTSASSGILLMSVGWTIWHGGYIAFLYSGGIPIEVLFVLPFTYFFMGIIFGSVFELGRGSLWPCVLLHAAFNAATVVYYTAYGRASELGSYVSELIFVAIAAGVLFRMATRKNRVSVQVSV